MLTVKIKMNENPPESQIRNQQPIYCEQNQPKTENLSSGN